MNIINKELKKGYLIFIKNSKFVNIKNFNSFKDTNIHIVA